MKTTKTASESSVYSNESKVLTQAEEYELFGRYEMGDLAARDALVAHNTRFVAKLAREFHNKGVPFEDLMQEGLIGLLDAIDKFDRTKGFRFTTFAAFSIRQAIIAAVRKQSNLIRIPQRKCQLLGQLTQIIQQHIAATGEKPPVQVLAEMFGETPKDIETLLSVSEGTISLEQPSTETERSLMDEVAVPESESSPLEQYNEECKRNLLNNMLKTLPPREEKLIRLRFGFDENGKNEEEDSSSLRAVGKAIGVSQEGARRIEHRILVKLGRAAYRKTLAELA